MAFNVTLTNSNCIFSNTSTTVTENTPYENRVTADTNYNLAEDDIQVLMSGIDISESAIVYRDNYADITIQEVTGDLIITAVASPDLLNVNLFVNNCIITNPDIQVSYGSRYQNTVAPIFGYLFVPNSVYVKVGDEKIIASTSPTKLEIDTVATSDITVCCYGIKASGRFSMQDIKFSNPGEYLAAAIISADQYVSSISSNTEVFDVVRLDSPDNFILDGVTLSWNPVTNAEGYELYRDNTRIANIGDPRIDLSTYFTAVGTYNLYVKALGKGLYTDSFRSDKYEYVITEVKPKLATPVITSISNDILYWEAVPNATNYNIYSNGTKLNSSTVTATNYSLSSLPSGVFEIQVEAKANNYTTSDKSESEEYTVTPIKLATPQNLVLANNILTWSAVPNKSYYQILVSSDSSTQTYSSSSTSCTLSTPTAIGNYRARVKAIGSGRYVDSDYSESVLFAVDKLATPQITLDSSTGTVTWTAISNASSYGIYLNGIQKTSITGTSININQYITASGSYTIYIVARSSSIEHIDSNRSNTETYNVESIVLDTPILNTLSGSTASWNSISHATSYTVFINNVAAASGLTSTSYNVETYLADKADGTYSINVKAIGTGLYRDSALSNTETYIVPIVYLNVPTNLTISNTTFSWSSVSHGKNYTVRVTGDESSYSYTGTSTSCNLRNYLPNPGNYNISVKANSWGRYRESAYATSILYEQIKLATPVNLSITGTTLSWTSVEHASSYTLYNGNTKIKENISSSVSSLNLRPDIIKTAGIYSLSLQAIGTGIYITSEKSTTVSLTITKLATPTLGIVSSELYWDIIPNADSYTIYTKINNVWTVLQAGITDNGFDLVDIIEDAGHHYLAIKAIGSGLYVDSELSSQVDYYIDPSTVLATPTNLTINGRELSWNAVTNATRYEVYCVYVPDSSTTIFHVSTNIVNLSTYLLQLGTYQIKVRAKAPGYNPSAYSSTIQFTMVAIPLPAPTNVQLSGTTISWNSVEFASGYKVYYKIGSGSPQALDTTTNLNLNLANYLSQANTYTIQVQALAGGTYSDSDLSDPVIFTIYSVRYDLQNCTSSSSVTAILPGGSYSTTITADEYYTLDSADILITVGGVDVTSTAYNQGVITLSNVSGNVVIDIEAASTAPPDAPIISITGDELTINEVTGVPYYKLYDTSDDSEIATIYPITTTLTNCSADIDNPNCAIYKSNTYLSQELEFSPADSSYYFTSSSLLNVSGITSYNWNYQTGVLTITDPVAPVNIAITAQHHGTHSG